MAKSEVNGTMRRPRRRQKDNSRVHEKYNAVNISHNLSIIRVVCTNIYLTLSDYFSTRKFITQLRTLYNTIRILIFNNLRMSIMVDKVV